jgi:hypothetical protein
MGERGTSSQVSVAFESHQRLEVEEARGCSSSSSSEEEEEEEKVQVKS